MQGGVSSVRGDAGVGMEAGGHSAIVGDSMGLAMGCGGVADQGVGVGEGYGRGRGYGSTPGVGAGYGGGLGYGLGPGLGAGYGNGQGYGAASGKVTALGKVAAQVPKEAASKAWEEVSDRVAAYKAWEKVLEVAAEEKEVEFRANLEGQVVVAEDMPGGGGYPGAGGCITNFPMPFFHGPFPGFGYYQQGAKGGAAVTKTHHMNMVNHEPMPPVASEMMILAHMNNVGDEQLHK